MLADVQLEIKSEDKLDLDQQLKAFQQRLLAQTVLPPSANIVNTNTENAGKEHKDTIPEEVIHFGWKEIANGPVIPFIKRLSEDYVAHRIVHEKVYKHIEKEFSSEMLCCMAPILERMTQKEADTFNEININHCDRSIVGEYTFKAREFMVKLDFVENMVQFYHACKTLIIEKNKFTDLFGFIEINGTNQVPFVWNNNRKLVPLFYFEGQSEYLDALSKDLTDIWKVCYLKFCCKVQKLRKELYEQHPFKVVDIENVKELFSADCTFEVQMPESINQNLLSPEIQMAWLHGMEPNAQCENRNLPITDKNHTVPEINNNKTDILPTNSQTELPNSNNKSLELQTTMTIPNSQHTALNQPLDAENVLSAPKNFTTKPINISEPNERLHNPSTEIVRSDKAYSSLTIPYTSPRFIEDRNRIQRSFSDDHITNNSNVTSIIPSNPKTQLHTSGTDVFKSVMVDPVSAPNNHFHKVNQDIITMKSSVANAHITNVPYQSPRSASSPLRQPSPFMSEAALRNQGLGEVSEIPFSSVKQTLVPNKEITQPRNLNLVNSNNTYFDTDYTNHYSHGQNILYVQSQTGLPYQNMSDHPSNLYPMNLYQQPSAQMCQSEGKQKKTSTRKHHYPVYQNMHQQAQQNIYPYPLNNNYDQSNQRSVVSTSILPIPSQYHRQNTISHPSHLHNFCNFDMNSHNNSLNPNAASTDLATAQEILKVNYNNDRANLENRLITLNYPAIIGRTPSYYPMKKCTIRSKYVLGISKYPNIHAFLINLSELVEKILGLNPFNFPTQLVSRFKSHYTLNPVQKAQWDQVVKEYRLEFVGPLKEVFVEYSEAVLMF